MRKSGKNGQMRANLFQFLYCSAAVAAIVTPAVAMAQNADSDETSSRAPTHVEEIIVTARRVAENNQNVPVSIGNLTTTDLESRQIQSLIDLKGSVAGLTTSRTATPGNSFITIRGVTGGNLPNVSTDTSVGFYVDGVYIGRGQGNGTDVADIARIEVLRGPQGTLFGRNNTAGAINIITNLPDEDLSVEARVRYGNYDRLRGDATVNIPITDTLFLRASYIHDERNGEVRNLSTSPGFIINASPGSPDYGAFKTKSRMGGGRSDAITARLRFVGLEGFTFDYKFDYTDMVEFALAQQVIGFTPTGNFLAELGVINASLAGNPNAVNQSFRKLHAFSSDFYGPSKVRNFGHLVNMELELDDRVAVRSITSYRETSSSAFLDFDGGQYFVPTGLPAPAPASVPFCVSCAANVLKQHQFSQEFQLIGDWQDLSVIFGGYYFDELGKLDTTYSNGSVIPYAPVAHTPTTDDFLPGGALGDYLLGAQETAKNVSYAVYGHAKYSITPSLTLAAGARFTIDDRVSIDRRITGTGRSGVEYNSFNWEASLSYDVDKNAMLYGRYANGYLSGGVIRGTPYRPQNTDQFEVGLKSELFDRNLRLNVAAYYTETTDQQVAFPNFNDPVSIAILTAAGLTPSASFPPFPFGLLQYNINGTSKIKGFEIEATATPIAGVTLSGAFGYNDLDPADGSRYLAPKTTLAFSAQYDAPQFANGSYVSFRADGDYRSKYYGTGLTFPGGFPGTVNPLLIPGEFNGDSAAYLTALEKESIAGDYWLVNARLSLLDVPAASGKAFIAAYVQNVFDKEGLLYVVNSGSLINGSYERGRTYGVEVGFRF